MHVAEKKGKPKRASPLTGLGSAGGCVSSDLVYRTVTHPADAWFGRRIGKKKAPLVCGAVCQKNILYQADKHPRTGIIMIPLIMMLVMLSV